MSEDKKAGLMSLPVELRIRIYEYILFPKRALPHECLNEKTTDHRLRQNGAQNLYDSEDKHFYDMMFGPTLGSGEVDSVRLIGSTTSLEPCFMRTFDNSRLLIFPTKAPSQKSFGGGAARLRGNARTPSNPTADRGSTPILAANKQIFQEAVEVLYQNTRVVAREPYQNAFGKSFIHMLRRYHATAPRDCFAGLPTYAGSHITRLHLRIFTHDDSRFEPFTASRLVEYLEQIGQHLLNLKTFFLHLDFDPDSGKGALNAQDFEELHILRSRCISSSMCMSEAAFPGFLTMKHFRNRSGL